MVADIGGSVMVKGALGATKALLRKLVLKFWLT
jgi:hypothetical protein